MPASRFGVHRQFRFGLRCNRDSRDRGTISAPSSVRGRQRGSAEGSRSVSEGSLSPHRGTSGSQRAPPTTPSERSSRSTSPASRRTSTRSTSMRCCGSWAGLRTARDAGAQVFIAGNGGSAATATHWVNDLGKATRRSGQRRSGSSASPTTSRGSARWPTTRATSACSPASSRTLARPGDVLAVISASGNSPNLLRAVEHARAGGMTSIGFLGFDGGRLLRLVDEALWVRHRPASTGSSSRCTPWRATSSPPASSPIEPRSRRRSHDPAIHARPSGAGRDPCRWPRHPPAAADRHPPQADDRVPWPAVPRVPRGGAPRRGHRARAAAPRLPARRRPGTLRRRQPRRGVSISYCVTAAGGPDRNRVREALDATRPDVPAAVLRQLLAAAARPDVAAVRRVRARRR